MRYRCPCVPGLITSLWCKFLCVHCLFNSYQGFDSDLSCHDGRDHEWYHVSSYSSCLWAIDGQMDKGTQTSHSQVMYLHVLCKDGNHESRTMWTSSTKLRYKRIKNSHSNRELGDKNHHHGDDLPPCQWVQARRYIVQVMMSWSQLLLVLVRLIGMVFVSPWGILISQCAAKVTQGARGFHTHGHCGPIHYVLS